MLFSCFGGRLMCINPVWMGPFLGMMARHPMPRSAVAGRQFQAAMPLLATGRSRARLRMTSYRGKSSATMIYDQLPINDVFRKIDDNAVLEAMDCKAMPTPFFFILRRAVG